MGARRPLSRLAGASVVDVGGVVVVAGDPVDEDAVVAAAHGRVAVFGSDRVDDKGSVVVGSEPWWRLSDWPGVAAQRSLRTQIKRARNKGLVIAPWDGQPSPALDADVDRWLRTRTLAPLGFVVDVENARPLDDPGARDVILVGSIEGAPVGLVVARVDGDRALVEHVIRDVAAPNGTGEALVDAVFRALAAAGVTEATLGLAPLRDDDAAPLPWLLRVIRDRTSGLFDWRGLTSWKEKLKPTSWRPLAIRARGVSRVTAIAATLLAFAHKRPLRFALVTLLHGPPLFFRAVAAALLPWTIGLALVDARHFPGPAVHAAWVAFDVVLATLLFWLAFRIKRRQQRVTLHRVMAVLVGVDAALTVAQAGLWNAPRAASGVDIAVLVVGVLAPLLVDGVLWASLRYRR
jgi:phosphatidylglycerol lysyltransferase